MIPRLYVPVTEPEDVVRHLGKKEKHWKGGKSAHALAYAWHGRADFPPAIDAALKGHSIFKSAKLIDGFLERQTDLGSSGRHSQTDLLAIVGVDDGLAILAVEGKAGESFGKYVEDWLDGTDEKEERLRGLCSILGLDRDVALRLRYQLLHRSASAILEAKRYRTSVAALLVHSFSNDTKGFADFGAFLQALRLETPTRGALVGPVERKGVSLYAGWVQDELERDGSSTYLDRLRDYAVQRIEECKKFRAWCDERSSKLKSRVE
jgi:hypothetical protein